VTDRRRLCPDVDFAAEKQCLLEQARAAAEAGVDVLQVRERDLEAAALAALVSDLIAVAKGSPMRIVVNDRLDVALAAGAAGVHLRSDSVAAAAVRSISPSGFLVGRSVHSAGEAAGAGPVDYLIAGTVWPTSSKPDGHAILGVEGLTQIVGATRVPVLAIGGVSLDTLRQLRRTGAAGAAAIGMFMTGSRTAGCRAGGLRAVIDAARARFDTSS
jgi:thiamine-phosphate pyrophosphorylase